MSKHTLGPWHWEADEVKGDPMGRIRYQVTAPGKTVTRVYYSSFEGGPTNAEADARLIAAAPELLEVAEAYLSWSSQCIKDPGMQHIESLARAAIAKATGEKQ